MTPSKVSRYPVWSTKAILLTSIPVIAITTILVFRLSSRSIFVELEITLSLIAAGLFLFLAIGLYQGIRLAKPSSATVAVSTAIPSDIPNVELPNFAITNLDLPKVEVDLPNVSDAGDDLISILLTIVLWIVIAVAAVAALWLVEQLLVTALPAVALLLYWIFYRALRVVFAKSRTCRGRLWLSMAYSLLYTGLYIGWLFAVVWISQYVVNRAS